MGGEIPAEKGAMRKDQTRRSMQGAWIVVAAIARKLRAPMALWPPDPPARSLLVSRISANLSSISFFSPDFDRIDSSQASVFATLIEESAFLSASHQQQQLTDLQLVKLYAKQASMLMLECLEGRLQRVAMETVFDVSGGKRDFLTHESAEELLKPLALPGNSYTSICLSNRSFGLDAAKVASRYFIDLKGQLRDANLADVVAGRQEAEALSVMSIFSSALAGCKLRSLDLSDNALGEKGVRAFSALLRSQDDLEELYFMNNGISEDAARAICELLPSARNLRILHFHNNMSGDGGAQALSELVTNASLLEDFRFSSTRVGADGGVALAEALQAGSSLKRIDLRDNPIGVRGGIALAKSLKQHGDLTEAYLSYLGLEDEGAEALLKALKEGAPGLRILELAGNEISEKTARVLADCIASKNKLTKLNLAENELKDKGIVTVSGALFKGHDSFAELDLSSNEMGRIGAVAAAKAVAQKSNFKFLNIDGNHISETGIEAVKEELQKGVCGVSVLGSLDENEEDDREIGMDEEEEEEEERDDTLEEELGKLKM